MPVYFIHGFRWPRAGPTGIRVHAIVHNLDDCSVEYVQNEASKLSILQSFRKAHPDIMQQLEDPRTGRTLDFIEQYDPQDEASDNAVSQAYAFIADHVITMATGTRKEVFEQGNKASSSHSVGPLHPNPSSDDSSSKKRITLSSVGSSDTITSATSTLHLNVEEAVSNASIAAPQALSQLRDKIAEGEKIGWWIVYNGDPERSFIDEEDEEDDDETESAGGSYHAGEIEEDSELKSSQESSKSVDHNDLAAGHTILNQPLPSLIPPDMKFLAQNVTSKQETDPPADTIAKAIPHPPAAGRSQATKSSSESTTPTRPKSNKSNFSFPLRRKTSKSNLPPPKEDDIPEPPELKEINKKEGRRYRFFGSKVDKKPA